MARIAIIGAHGKVGQQLMRQLYDAGDDFIGIVRGEEHAEDIYRLGGEGVRLDLEATDAAALADAIRGADALVFTAGAGAGSGVPRKRTVDYGASVLSIEAAKAAGIRRFVQVSAAGVDDPATAQASPDPQWAAYVEAKRDADAALRDSGLEWTILRPTALTLDEGTGLIELGEHVDRESGRIPRADVAATIIAVLGEDGSIGKQWELTGGNTPIAEAVARSV
ncbi:SDR family oxidoreductase [Gryllotalpicola ginsengisoli]|uniref:SDR family oxidoreductase n=1 Tax=Gryllotalpicola ginsengisoli TaxID=444608 RepID=UPI0003B66C22|nr:SDR family oxidoreductase [Gryllotalpicola ginsengisoli]